MSVRKRKWKTKSGAAREAWFVDYTDQHGVRVGKQFAKKKDADAFAASTHTEVRQSSHIADYATKTVKQAGEKWLKRAEESLEVMTVKQYEQHLRLHILPFLGDHKLTRITVPVVREFMDKLRDAGRSPAMVKSIRTSLSGILAEAQERGWSNQNAVRDMSQGRKGRESKGDKRRKAKLVVGRDIPTREEIQKVIAQLNKPDAAYRQLIITAIFTGMRASELRGLRWDDIDFARKEITVRQRADATNDMGPPKSEAGQRTIEMAPMVINTLKDWKDKCPKGELGLVFPTQKGTVQRHENIVRRGLWEPQIAAGLTKQKVLRTEGRVPLLKDGKEQLVTVAKYEGLHALRHFFASWCLNPMSLGGQGKNPMEVQKELGHSTIALTMDTYGHLFKKTKNDGALARAEAALLKPVTATQTQHAG
ncbi:tyrosine-type recombinase/integrase [Mesorhizobium sp. CO1-1-8]|uniref:tyrosine-type recombinase/integrase n=1 Tax=Mesorhizobium sp. CO1-1-8 TaxID=2876631 RepID=UPI001CD07ED5|nr:site-specific integrase [Mesorhizobium sp. CO1-1-8]MBZ9774382.1 site-specific integrase [Mesorhizobium sp. CO1-1-8]